MASWQLLSDERAREIWDQNLIRFNDFTLYQTYAWGEHRRFFGWVPFRWVAYGDAGEIVAMVQALYRPYKLGIGILWSSGGPVGDIST